MAVSFVVHGNKTYEYEIVRTKRRSVALSVSPQGAILVRTPMRFSNERVEEFVLAKIEWLVKVLNKVSQYEPVVVTKQYSREEIRCLFTERYEEVAKLFSYASLPQLDIKVMRRRWGSYRSNGSIALNAKLIHTPLSSLDYVIAHELCHHTHMNHSKNFYALLQEKCPEWKEEKKKLERFGSLVCE